MKRIIKEGGSSIFCAYIIPFDFGSLRSGNSEQVRRGAEGRCWKHSGIIQGKYRSGYEEQLNYAQGLVGLASGTMKDSEWFQWESRRTHGHGWRQQYSCI